MRPFRLPDLAPRSARASGDRWLFGYADVVTLLFACFAALYAAGATSAPAHTAGHSRIDTRLRPETERLEAEIAALRAAEPGVAIEIARRASEITISLAEAGSFAPGSAALTPAAMRVMARLAVLLQGATDAIRVEGHTDDRPIRNRTYASNWELSTARATTVVQWLVERGRIDPSRLSAAGYAEYHPREPNVSEQARARNRRVDLIVLSRLPQGPPSVADYTAGGVRPPG